MAAGDRLGHAPLPDNTTLSVWQSNNQPLRDPLHVSALIVTWLWPEVLISLSGQGGNVGGVMPTTQVLQGPIGHVWGDR